MSFGIHYEGGVGREWTLHYVLVSDSTWSTFVCRIVNFRALDRHEVKRMLLEFLKISIRETKGLNGRFGCVLALPAEPLPGHDVISVEEIVRLKDNFSDRRILRVQDPAVAFVDGYGPEALRELET